MKPFKNLFLVLAVIMLALAACGTPATQVPAQPEEPATTAAPVEPTVDPKAPVKGGVVVVGTPQEPGTLSPLLASATIDDVISAFVIEGLVTVDGNGEYAPVLAEQLPTVSEDGLLVTYKLKKDIKFSNGEPFTCADVQFTYEAIVSDLSGASTSGYSDIEKIDCPDEFTAEVYFTEVYAPYLRLFSYIVPKGAGDLAAMDTWAYNRAPIGTGPWMVKEWVAGDYIEFQPNPNYREAGKPYLSSVIVKILPSRETGVQLLGTGEITVLWDLTEADLPTIDQLDGVAWSGATYGYGENELLVFNFGPTDGSAPADPSANPHPSLSDLRVRQAIQYGINKQLIVDTLLGGNVKVGTTVLPIGFWACPQPASEFNVEKAKSLLDEAGWMVGTDGIREKDGVRLSLKISSTTGNQLREQTEQVLVEMMKEIGVELLIDNLPSDVLLAGWDSDGMRKKGRFDILLYTTGGGYDPDSHLFTNYHSARIPSGDNEGAGNNFSRYINAEVDALIDEAAFNSDQEARKAAYCKIAGLINQDVPRVFLYERMVISGYREALQNFRVSPGYADMTLDSQNWWLKP